MKKIKSLLFVSFLLTSTFFYGQKEHDHNKIKALKIAYITEHLNLSSNEAEIFWPIYNEHEAEIKAIRKREYLNIKSKIKNAKELSEEAANKLLLLAFDLEREKLKLKLTYYKEMSKIISSKKTVLLMQAEEGFKRKLIKQYHHKNHAGKH